MHGLKAPAAGYSGTCPYLPRGFSDACCASTHPAGSSTFSLAVAWLDVGVGQWALQAWAGGCNIGNQTM